MKNLIVSIGVLALFLLPFPVLGSATPDPKYYIALFAQKYGLNEQMMLDVAKCESGLNQLARGDSGVAVGIYQFHRGTWDMFSKELGEKLDIDSVHDQAKLASWSFAHGKERHWSCWKQIADLSRS